MNTTWGGREYFQIDRNICMECTNDKNCEESVRDDPIFIWISHHIYVHKAGTYRGLELYGGGIAIRNFRFK